MKYYTNGVVVRAFEDNIDASKWLDMSEYMAMTDDEVDKHLNPKKYMTDDEKTTYERDSMAWLPRVELLRRLYLKKGITEENIKEAINGIAHEQERELLKIDIQRDTFQRNSKITTQVAKLLNITDKELDEIWLMESEV